MNDNMLKELKNIFQAARDQVAGNIIAAVSNESLKINRSELPGLLGLISSTFDQSLGDSMNSLKQASGSQSDVIANVKKKVKKSEF